MKSQGLRKYGSPPFRLAVIHGGPGAPGEMKPVAEELSSGVGVLEPFQTELSIEDQVDELKDTLEKAGDIPVTLIGYSWGAWLSIIFSAIYPALVEKIVLVGSPPFREKYADQIVDARFKRLGETEGEELRSLTGRLDKSGEVGEEYLTRLGELAKKADSYDPISTGDELEDIEVQPEVYRRIWTEAREVRRSGELLELAQLVKSPVVAIHGDHDPHPAEGVREPLSQNVNDFRFILLEECGHTPWIESNARDKFYVILKSLIP